MSFNGIWGRSPTDIYAVGTRGTILHWNGTRWTSSKSGTTEDLLAIWGHSSKDIFIVGANGTILRKTREQRGFTFSVCSMSPPSALLPFRPEPAPHGDGPAGFVPPNLVSCW